MTKKALKLINIIAGLDLDTHEDLIDEIICSSINNGVNVEDNYLEEEALETICM